jgi:subtilisin family serine protease
MNALELVKLTPLMERTSGRPEIVIALIDGPVLMDSSDLWSSNVRHLGSGLPATCAQPTSGACMHGTFVAGILSARRGSLAPAICPECNLLVRPIFPETNPGNGALPSATPEELATAIVEAVEAGARVINLSAALAQPSMRGERSLKEALDSAMAHGVIVVAAAGNQGRLGSSAITRHPWVIPVAGCDIRGRPVDESNFGSSAGRRGLSAPAENITSLGTDGQPVSFGGTSAAAPFVTGTVALLWSEFPTASASAVKHALLGAGGAHRNTVVPPVLNASAAYQAMAAVQGR